MASSSPAHSLVENLIRDLDQEWLSECEDLLKILRNPHVKALVSVSDCIARNVYESDKVNRILQVLANTTDQPLGGDSDSEEKLQPRQNILSLKRRKFVRHRLVNVIKSDEPLGVTVRFDEQTGDIFLARVLVGGAAHRSGLVNVGDRIVEVNGIGLRGRSHLEVINILQRECRKTIISFRIVVRKQFNGPTGLSSGEAADQMGARSMIVRAHFDYDPSHDTQIPCDQIGLQFSAGTILSILNRDDTNWWQASKEIEVAGTTKPRMEVFEIAGLVPSKSLQERRVVAIREMRNKLDGFRYITILAGLIPVPFCKYNWPMRKVKKIMYDIGESVKFDREEIATYEPVSKFLPDAHYFRPILLIGPVGMGLSGLIKTLVNFKPNRYCEPLLHTSRYKRFAENDGIDFWFVSESWFEKEIKRENFVWHSKIRGNYYGVHKNSVRAIINASLVCIFKMDASFLRQIHTGEFKPYVIFIRPPFDVGRLVEQTLKNRPRLNRKSRPRLEYEMQLVIYEAHKMLFLYGHKFDSVLVNENLNATFKNLYDILVSVENEPKWVPTTWLHSK